MLLLADDQWECSDSDLAGKAYRVKKGRGIGSGVIKILKNFKRLEFYRQGLGQSKLSL